MATRILTSERKGNAKDMQRDVAGTAEPCYVAAKPQGEQCNFSYNSRSAHWLSGKTLDRLLGFVLNTSFAQATNYQSALLLRSSTAAGRHIKLKLVGHLRRLRAENPGNPGFAGALREHIAK